LGKDGLADVGKKMDNGDIFVNKYVPIITEEARAMIS
jgi:DNA-directed RNA polymerase beta subunit